MGNLGCRSIASATNEKTSKVIGLSYTAVAAMNVLRFHFSSVPEAKELLTNAANDSHGRVRMTAAAVTASYLPKKIGLETLASADDQNDSAIYKQTFDYAREVLNRQPAESELKERKIAAPSHFR